jgi:hypothetical protein
VAWAFAGCAQPAGGPAVTLGFRAPAGTELVYDVDVTTSVVSQLEGPHETRHDHVRLLTRQTVGDTTGNQVRVNVEVTPEDGTVSGGTRHYVARFDRDAGLAALESIDGLAPAFEGDLGPAEVLPGATDALPGRRLRAGDRWRIDQRLALPGAPGKTHLRGQGRLVGLRSSAESARVATNTTLPVRRRIAVANGDLEMVGDQKTTTDADYNVTTGAVERSRAKSVGHYVVVIPPPPGSDKRPVEGTLVVTVTSTAVRRAAHAEPSTTINSALAGIAAGGVFGSGAAVPLPSAVLSASASRSKPGLKYTTVAACTCRAVAGVSI